MADTYSSNLRIRLQENGANSATWGTITNTNFDLFEDAIAGKLDVATTGGTTVLTASNGAADESRYAILKITGVLVSNATIQIPDVSKEYLIWNATSGAYTVTVKCSGGSGVVVLQGSVVHLFTDGSEVYQVETPLSDVTGFGTGVATALAIAVGSPGAPVVNGGALGTPSSGTLTNCTGLPAAGVSGTALVGADIGVTVQGYDADTTKNDVANVFTVDQTLGAGVNLIFEGTTADAFETTLTAGEPTADRTVTLPNATTTLAGLSVDQSFTGNQTFKEVTDTVYTIVDGAAFEIDPGNGAIQVVTLGASRTPAATNFAAGQCVLLGIDDGSAYSVTWTTVNPTWVKVGGSASAPTLATSGYTFILLWKVGSVIYGTEVGRP